MGKTRAGWRKSEHIDKSEHSENSEQSRLFGILRVFRLLPFDSMLCESIQNTNCCTLMQLSDNMSSYWILPNVVQIMTNISLQYLLILVYFCPEKLASYWAVTLCYPHYVLHVLILDINKVSIYFP